MIVSVEDIINKYYSKEKYSNLRENNKKISARHFVGIRVLDQITL